MGRELLFTCLVLVAVLVTTTSRARSPYKVRPAIDVPLTIAVLGGAAALQFTAPETLRLSCHPCDRSTLNALDRGVVAPMHGVTSRITDVMLTMALMSPFAMSAVHERFGTDARTSEQLIDGLVTIQAMGVTLMLTQIAKYAVKRPRPFTYSIDYGAPGAVPVDHGLSFFSGHTSLAFAGVVSGLTTLRHRGLEGAPFAVTTGLGLALASAVGIGRVKAARHFWTDVMVGAAVGSLVGWLVPWLHLRGDSPLGPPVESEAIRIGSAGVAGTF